MQTLTELPSGTLYFREGSSDKDYQCQLKQAGECFAANLAYGRRGPTLYNGAKTKMPVNFDVAKRIFDKLMKEKKVKGYRERLAALMNLWFSVQQRVIKLVDSGIASSGPSTDLLLAAEANIGGQSGQARANR